jgi:hypothetical protein
MSRSEEFDAAREAGKITATSYDSKGNNLAMEDDVDAPMVFHYYTAKEAMDHARRTGYGYRYDDASGGMKKARIRRHRLVSGGTTEHYEV